MEKSLSALRRESGDTEHTGRIVDVLETFWCVKLRVEGKACVTNARAAEDIVTSLSLRSLKESKISASRQASYKVKHLMLGIVVFSRGRYPWRIRPV